MPIHPFLLKIRRKKAFAIGGACLLALLICLAVHLCLPMPNGAAVDGFDLSGLPYWRARMETKDVYPQPLRVSLPMDELRFVPEDCGVKLHMGAAVRSARVRGENVELRTFLTADEAAIREKLTKYAQEHDTTYREAEWHLTGTTPELATDRFDPEAEGQTLVVTVGQPEAHLDVDNAVNQILEAFSHPLSRNGDLIELTVTPERIPEMPDWEALAAEVFVEPVNDAPDRETGGILPGRYGQSIDVSNVD
ncbi:MAG: hypothetical protein MSH58_10795, partial [Clostridiales bacterium]|nr:hypothetical protein [Clostridiales bacterium]